MEQPMQPATRSSAADLVNALTRLYLVIAVCVAAATFIAINPQPLSSERPIGANIAFSVMAGLVWPATLTGNL